MRKKSEQSFSRWESYEESTWVFQVFQKYDGELNKGLLSYFLAFKKIYNHLGENSADWTDSAKIHFEFPFIKEEKNQTLKEWSDNFNNFDNWVNLNVIMSISSNFETYFASVISLALKSDPGILFGASKLIDGASILKNGIPLKFNIEEQIKLCTKGDWNSRIKSFEKIFGFAPDILNREIRNLEKIRKLRNKVGHSFGRDIEEARDHTIKKLLPIEILSRDKTIKYQNLLFSIAKEIDKYLLINHIGTFQPINFYHLLYPKLDKEVHQSIRAVKLKKVVGQTGVWGGSKLFYKQLVKYYESL